jgi:hypothetical protein
MLAKKGLLHGIATAKKAPHRWTFLLEVGAINIKLFSAALERLHVGAIDLHSI